MLCNNYLNGPIEPTNYEIQIYHNIIRSHREPIVDRISSQTRKLSNQENLIVDPSNPKTARS